MPRPPVSSEEVIHEREALEEMLRSDGWTIFAKRVMNEWAGQGYFTRMGGAVVSDDPIAPKVIHRTAIEMQNMLTWPKNRVQHLGGKVE